MAKTHIDEKSFSFRKSFFVHFLSLNRLGYKRVLALRIFLLLCIRLSTCNFMRFVCTWSVVSQTKPQPLTWMRKWEREKSWKRKSENADMKCSSPFQCCCNSRRNKNCFPSPLQLFSRSFRICYRTWFAVICIYTRATIAIL